MFLERVDAVVEDELLQRFVDVVGLGEAERAVLRLVDNTMIDVAVRHDGQGERVISCAHSYEESPHRRAAQTFLSVGARELRKVPAGLVVQMLHRALRQPRARTFVHDLLDQTLRDVLHAHHLLQPLLAAQQRVDLQLQLVDVQLQLLVLPTLLVEVRLKVLLAVLQRRQPLLQQLAVLVQLLLLVRLRFLLVAILDVDLLLEHRLRFHKCLVRLPLESDVVLGPLVVLVELLQAVRQRFDLRRHVHELLHQRVLVLHQRQVFVVVREARHRVHQLDIQHRVVSLQRVGAMVIDELHHGRGGAIFESVVTVVVEYFDDAIGSIFLQCQRVLAWKNQIKKKNPSESRSMVFEMKVFAYRIR